MFVHVLFTLSVVQVLFVRAGRHYDDAIQTYNMDGRNYSNNLLDKRV